jgi:bacteriocin-like protein
MENNAMTATITASAALVELSDAELNQVSGGKITDNYKKQNGGGNTPNGQANGVPVVYTGSTNPAGKEPPGQQLD